MNSRKLLYIIYFLAVIFCLGNDKEKIKHKIYITDNRYQFLILITLIANFQLYFQKKTQVVGITDV